MEKVLTQTGVHMKTSLGARPVIYPTPVFAVGTYDAAGKPHVMAVAWGGIAGGIISGVEVFSLPRLRWSVTAPSLQQW